MKEFASKLSLYDILSMLIPGGTIFLFISLTLGYKLKIDNSEIDTVLGWTIALVISYLLGLINHICTTISWKWFRNNHMLWKEKTIHFRDTLCFMDICLLCLITLSILGCLLLHIKNEQTICLIISITFLTVFICGITEPNKKQENDTSQHIRKQYYDKYYYVMKNRYNDDIPIMEGQVAFLQNMLYPLALFLFVTLQILLKELISEEGCCFYKNIWWFIALLFLLLIGAIFYRQNKIDERISEDYEFLMKIRKK